MLRAATACADADAMVKLPALSGDVTLNA